MCLNVVKQVQSKRISRNQIISVGTKPDKKILIHSLAEKGSVATPYAPFFPYKQ